MPDRLRVVTLPSDGRPAQVLYNLADGTNFAPIRDSFSVTGPANQPVSAQPGGRWGGSRTVTDRYENGAVAVGLLVNGVTSADATIQKVSDVLSAIDPVKASPNDPYYLEWRPQGASRSTYFELRGPGAWEFAYSWIKFTATKTVEITLNFPVAPLALGDRMDTYDDYATDSRSDYAYLVGSSSDVAITGGALQRVSGTPRLVHADRGYKPVDTQVTVEFDPAGSFGASDQFDLITKVQDNGDHLRLRFTQSGYDLSKVVSGAATSLTSGATSFPATDAAVHWFVLRSEGNTIYLEKWDREPYPGGTPNVATSVILSGTNATQFGAGVPGRSGLSMGANWPISWKVNSLRIEPYTFIDPVLPNTFLLEDVPGDAPALCDVHLGKPDSSSQGFFVCLGWGTPKLASLVQNGNFEDDGVTGWQSSASPNFGAAVAAPSTGPTQSAGGTSKFGTYSAQFTAADTTLRGPWTRLYGSFKAGRTYTASAWVLTDSTRNARVYFGNASNFGNASSTVTSGVWTLLTATWVPSADSKYADIAVASSGAAGTTRFDAVVAYEGATPPTSLTQTTGYGGYAPFGMIMAANDAQANPSPATIVDSPLATGGYGAVSRIPVGGGVAGSKELLWYVDPSLLLTDDYQADIAIEFYARYAAPAGNYSSLNFLLKATPSVVGMSGAPVYTNEYGSTGKKIVTPYTGTNSPSTRIVRLGTLVFPVEQLRFSNPRYKLSFTASWGTDIASGNLDIDYLFAVPSNSRAASPTGKARAGYTPVFATAAGGQAEVKRIMSNLVGRSYLRPSAGEMPSAAMGGCPIEITPGDARVAAFMSGTSVPDDPTATSTDDDGNGTKNMEIVRFSITPRYRLARGS